MKRLPVYCVLLAILCGACSKPATHDDIRFAIAQAPLNLDPRYATDAASARINRLLYRPLVDFDAHSRPQAALADWQAITPQHYRFTLRAQGREFHDGRRLTAQDVVATYSSLLALKDSPHRAEFAHITRIEARDDNSVDFRLDQADDAFPARLIIGILPAALIAVKHDFAHHPVGSGAFKLLAWRDSVRLQRIRDGQVVSISEVKDPTVRILKLLRGEVDMLQGDLPPELVAYLKRQPGIRLQTSPGANFSYLGINLRDPVLSKPLVRQALAHAVDRDSIIQHAMVQDTRPAGALLPPEHWAGNAALPAYRYDPELARRLLLQAGVSLPLHLSYKTSTDAQRVRLATIMQAQMAAAGIVLDIHSLDWGTFFDDIKHGQFQLYGLTWVGIKTPEIYRLAFGSDAVPPKGANRGHYADPLLDALLARQDWQAASARIHAQLPYVPLWYEGQFAALRSDIHHFPLYADGNWDGLESVSR